MMLLQGRDNLEGEAYHYVHHDDSKRGYDYPDLLFGVVFVPLLAVLESIIIFCARLHVAESLREAR